MFAFVVRRLLGACLSVFLAAVLVFSALLAIPGDPATAILGLNSSPEALAALREQLGLDVPPVTRFFGWFGGVLRGDFGTSINYRAPVRGLLAEGLAVSLPLALAGMVVACLIALPLGVLAALRRGTLLDPLVVVAAQLGAAVPSFWLGLLLILLFSVQLGWLPSGGQDSPLSPVLPVITLGVGGAAILARFTRSAMLEVLGQPYIRTASAKGVPWRAVVRGHALPNAAIPTVTVVGFMIGSLMAGAVVVESVFSWPGVGRLLVVAVSNRDLAVVQIAGLIARRILCDIREGDKVQAGDRFGIIRFGSRTDVYLPEGIRPGVMEGQTMIGGETVIADLAPPKFAL